jgi:ADP-L-glycero-D-manno-heptose 6-epimerase
MRVIVTGGAGFIGSMLVNELQRRDAGAVITVIDDFTSGNFKNLTGFTGDICAVPCEELDWEAHFGYQDIDCIYHLASITDTTVTDQRLMLERNVEGFRNVLDYAWNHGVRVVYASSAATYGLAGGIMRETQNPAAANVYGFSKTILDNLARRYSLGGDAPPIAGVRYFNVFGPHEQHKGKMASMAYQLYLQLRAGQRPRVFKHGGQCRDFVYVKDAVAGTLLAGECNTPGVYNIGSGAATSFNEMIAHLNAALGMQLEPEYIDNPYEAFYQNHTQADLTLSRQQLGYAPRWPMAQAVADYVAWLDHSGAAL